MQTSDLNKFREGFDPPLKRDARITGKFTTPVGIHVSVLEQFLLTFPQETGKSLYRFKVTPEELIGGTQFNIGEIVEKRGDNGPFIKIIHGQKNVLVNKKYLQKHEKKNWTVGQYVKYDLDTIYQGHDSYVEFLIAQNATVTVTDSPVERINNIGRNFQGIYCVVARESIFKQLLETLINYMNSKEYKYVYLHFFNLGSKNKGTTSDLRKEYVEKIFPKFVASFEKVVVFIDSWVKAPAMSKGWCLYEIYAALKYKTKLTVLHTERMHDALELYPEDALHNTYKSYHDTGLNLVTAYNYIDLQAVESYSDNDLGIIKSQFNLIGNKEAGKLIRKEVAIYIMLVLQKISRKESLVESKQIAKQRRCAYFFMSTSWYVQAREEFGSCKRKIFANCLDLLSTDLTPMNINEIFLQLCEKIQLLAFVYADDLHCSQQQKPVKTKSNQKPVKKKEQRKATLDEVEFWKTLFMLVRFLKQYWLDVKPKSETIEEDEQNLKSFDFKVNLLEKINKLVKAEVKSFPTPKDPMKFVTNQESELKVLHGLYYVYVQQDDKIALLTSKLHYIEARKYSTLVSREKKDSKKTGYVKKAKAAYLEAIKVFTQYSGTVGIENRLEQEAFLLMDFNTFLIRHAKFLTAHVLQGSVTGILRENYEHLITILLPSLIKKEEKNLERLKIQLTDEKTKLTEMIDKKSLSEQERQRFKFALCKTMLDDLDMRIKHDAPLHKIKKKFETITINLGDLKGPRVKSLKERKDKLYKKAEINSKLKFGHVLL